MLTDIHLTGDQMASLQLAARTAQAELLTDYRGEFRPAGSPGCLALLCISPAQLMRFAGHVTLARGIEPALLTQLVSRVTEDAAGRRKVYYWPGVIAP